MNKLVIIQFSVIYCTIFNSLDELFQKNSISKYSGMDLDYLIYLRDDNNQKEEHNIGLQSQNIENKQNEIKHKID